MIFSEKSATFRDHALGAFRARRLRWRAALKLCGDQRRAFDGGTGRAVPFLMRAQASPVLGRERPARWLAVKSGRDARAQGNVDDERPRGCRLDIIGIGRYNRLLFNDGSFAAQQIDWVNAASPVF